MSTSFYLKLYVLTVPLFFIIDLIWLGVVAKGFYLCNLRPDEIGRSGLCSSIPFGGWCIVLPLQR